LVNKAPRSVEHVLFTTLSGLCRLEHVDGQRQSYNSAASRTVGDPSRAAVRMDNRIDKRKSETVPRRMFSLYEALESPAANFKRESRTIVFDHQFC
jgi:hypothetical protein